MKSLSEVEFLSTLSLRRATILLPRSADCNYHFYPRSPYGERQRITKTVMRQPLFLSTLSLRRATEIGKEPDAPDEISIHALLTESDVARRWNLDARQQFLSTLSLRRATICVDGQTYGIEISIHALLTESDTACTAIASKSDISIHALLTESDLSARDSLRYTRVISIHALLTESDRHEVLYGQNRTNFYPRSPYGERRLVLFERLLI